MLKLENNSKIEQLIERNNKNRRKVYKDSTKTPNVFPRTIFPMLLLLLLAVIIIVVAGYNYHIDRNGNKRCLLIETMTCRICAILYHAYV